MNKSLPIHPLTLVLGALILASIAGIRVSVAADIAADPQQQAANVLQQPTRWTADTDGFNESFASSHQALDPQQQAQRVLQPPVRLPPAGSSP